MATLYTEQCVGRYIMKNQGASLMAGKVVWLGHSMLDGSCVDGKCYYNDKCNICPASVVRSE